MSNGISDFFNLKAPISRSSNANEDDVIKTKTALQAAGHYEIPEYGVTPWPDVKMFDGLEAFQKKHGLKVDGVMNPTGPTEKALGGTIFDGRLRPAKRPRISVPPPQTPKVSAPKRPAARAAQTPKPRAKPIAKAQPWWRSDHVPQASDADIADNARAVAVLKKQIGHGEHPRWVAEAIASGDERAKAKLADMAQQLEKAAPGRGAAYVADAEDRLTPDKVRMLQALAVPKQAAPVKQPGSKPAVEAKSGAPESGNAPTPAATGSKGPSPKAGNAVKPEDIAAGKSKAVNAEKSVKKTYTKEEFKAINERLVKRIDAGDVKGVAFEVRDLMANNGVEFDWLSGRVKTVSAGYWNRKQSKLAYDPKQQKHNLRWRERRALEGARNAAASRYDLEAFKEPALKAALDVKDGVQSLFAKPMTVDEYKTAVDAIEARVPEAMRNTAQFHKSRRHARAVGTALELASALTGKKVIQAGAAGVIAFKKAGQVSNTLAKAGLSPEIQSVGASLTAAVTLGGGPVLKLLQKGGVAKLGKLAPDLVGALRSMTPAQAEALTSALNDAGVDLSIDAGVRAAIPESDTKNR